MGVRDGLTPPPGLAIAPVTAAPGKRALGWWSNWRDSIGVALVFFVVFKVVIDVVGLVAVYGWSSGLHHWHDTSALMTIWRQWDAGWYLAIADGGYVHNSHVLLTAGVYQDASVFPPLFPALIRGVGDTLHVSSLAAASLIVAASLPVALVGFHRLVRLDFDSPTALWACLLMLAFPSALFLGAVYTEALLLALLVWCFLCARRRQWWAAGALAAAAVLTKIYAVVVVGALLVEYAQLEGWSWQQRPRLRAAWLVAAPALAIGSWMAYLTWRFREPLRFLTSQASWNHYLAGPWVPIRHSLSILVGHTHGESRLLALLDAGSLAALAVLGVYALLRVRRSYGVFMLLSAIVFLSTSELSSVNRHALTIFPLFIVAAVAARPRPWLAATAILGSATVGGHLLTDFVRGGFAG